MGSISDSAIIVSAFAWEYAYVSSVSAIRFADEFGVHAVTFELGDNTNRVMLEHLAQQSAKEMVKKLVTTPAAEFVAFSPKS